MRKIILLLAVVAATGGCGGDASSAKGGDGAPAGSRGSLADGREITQAVHTFYSAIYQVYTDEACMLMSDAYLKAFMVKQRRAQEEPQASCSILSENMARRYPKEFRVGLLNIRVTKVVVRGRKARATVELIGRTPYELPLSHDRDSWKFDAMLEPSGVVP